ARVADAEGAGQRVLAKDVFQVVQFSGCAAHLQQGGLGRAHCDASRVVTAILKAAQSFEDDRNDFLPAYIAYDSAHGFILCEWWDGQVVERSSGDAFLVS